MASRPALVAAAATAMTLLLSGCAAPPPAPAEGPVEVSVRHVAPGTRAVVYRTPSCSCCHEHEAHLRAAGFEVESQVVEDLAAVKQRLGVPDDMGSCHTSEVAGYFVEGHVPADVIAKLLKERPVLDGIALPGMPAGAPGMGDEKPEPLVVQAVSGGTATAYAVR